MTSAAESDATQETIDAVVQTSFEVVAVVTRIGAEHDLSLTLVRMLGILRDRVLTPAELANYLGLERSTVSGLVDRAERRGLVERRASDLDGRSVRLALSARGQDVVGAAADVIAERLRPTVEQLPADVRRALSAALGQLQLVARG